MLNHIANHGVKILAAGRALLEPMVIAIIFNSLIALNFIGLVNVVNFNGRFYGWAIRVAW